MTREYKSPPAIDLETSYGLVKLISWGDSIIILTDDLDTTRPRPITINGVEYTLWETLTDNGGEWTMAHRYSPQLKNADWTRKADPSDAARRKARDLIEQVIDFITSLKGIAFQRAGYAHKLYDDVRKAEETYEKAHEADRVARDALTTAMDAEGRNVTFLAKLNRTVEQELAYAQS